MSDKTNRRNFLRLSSLAGLGMAMPKETHATTPIAVPIIGRGKPKDKLKVGLIGVGMRGRNHLDLFLRRSDCEVAAICDIDPGALAESQKMIAVANRSKAMEYGKDEHDYHRMIDKEKLDAVIIATPWEWHSEQAIACMRAGVYVGSEVCGGFSIDECWELVNTHEETGTHLFFMENVCYRRDIMAVLNMVRRDLFGELIHVEGGYQHDLREVKFNDGKQPYGGGVEFGEKGFSEARWRTNHSVHRNGDLYPTHGVGPVAMMLDINRGNRFVSLTSTASKARGLHEYIVNHPKGGKSHPNAQVEFKLGDVVTSVIKCSNGETIILSHDTNLARPYSLGFRVQGVKGIWMDVNKSIYIEGVSEKAHTWESAEGYLQKYDHPLWQRYQNDAQGAGHGGMDFFVLNSFVECVKGNHPAQIDVYDAASWLAITPLSEASVATGSSPQSFPDFSRGRWMKKKNDFATNELY
jgi:predicted dehydrogenase